MIVTQVDHVGPDPICIPTRGESLTDCQKHGHVPGPTPNPRVTVEFNVRSSADYEHLVSLLGREIEVPR